MGIDDRTLEETASHIAIQRLLAAYADAVNRRAWGELGELFLDDATIEITPLQRPPLQVTGPEAIGRFIDESIARFDFLEFVLQNSRLEIRQGEDSARARNYICEYRREKATAKWTQVFGVYHDRYRRIEGRWWFEHRVFHPLAATGSDNVVFEVPGRLAALLAERL
jgi:SnoaL-like domain